MGLEELRKKHQQLDARLEQLATTQADMLRCSIATTTRGHVRRAKLGPLLDIFFYLTVFTLSGAFIGNHWGVWSLVAPAAFIMLYATVLFIDSIRRLAQLSLLDWDGPLAKIQEILARFRYERVRQLKWLLLFSPLLGTSTLILLLQSVLDQSAATKNALDLINPVWLGGMLAFGIAFVPLGYFALQHLGKFDWARRVADALSGSGARQAEAEARRWAELVSPPATVS